MKSKTPAILLITIVFALLLCGAVSAADTNVSVANVHVPFVENQGQTDPSVNYYADTYYGTAYITEDGITHSVTMDNTTSVALQEQFLDENSQPVATNPSGEEQSQTQVNYFIGNDQSQWQTNLNTYNQVNLGELYPGITVKARAHGGNVEKLFHIQPGSNVDDILVQILGANSLEILEDGTLAIQTDAGVINMAAPKAYQGYESVNVAYRLLTNNTYGFTTGNYDDSKELIIDPTLEYSTYLGGSGNTDYGYGIAIDSSNNVYITGYTNSANFSTTTGVFQTNNSGGTDVFVTKLNPSGTGLIYSTYLGGSNNENAWSIAIDSSGNAYVTGLTNSANFPTTTGAYQTIRPGGTYDAFVFKLNPDGTGLIYSTFMGGSDNDQGYDIAVDNSGYAYITGYTKSTNFPITAGAFQTSNLNQGGIASEDAFVSKLNPDGTGLIYSTYLGGGSAGDYGYGIAIDSSGNAYIAGYTSASNFPVTPGAFQTTKSSGYDAFVSKLNPTGANLIYSTFIGATSDDYGYGIAVDNSGNAYISGVTASTSFPTTTGAFQTSNAGGQDVFVSKLNPDGNGLDYCTYIGGSGTDLGRKIVINRSGYAFITGNTGSTNFPVTTGAFQTTYGGGTNDAYVSKLNPTGTSLVYNTYLGGTGAENGRNIAMDSSGSIYITGITNSANFPVTAGAFQMVQGGGTNDAFVAKFSFESSPVAPVADFTATPTTGNAPLAVQFTESSTNSPTSWLWEYNSGSGWETFASGTDSAAQNPLYTFNTPGVYDIRLTATNGVGSDDETKVGFITVNIPPAPVADFTATPTTGNAPLAVQFTDTSANTPTSWLWEYNSGSGWTIFASGTDSAAQNPLYTFNSLGTYDIRLTTTNGMGSDDETKVGFITVSAAPQIDLTITGLVNTIPASAVFAWESNAVTVAGVKNNGTDTATNIVVALYASDVSSTVPVATTTITSLTGGATASTLNFTDPTIRTSEGTVTYTTIVDPDNLIVETVETNNSKSSVAKPLRYNGYKGKRYWDGGSDITTKSTYDLRGDIVYYTQPSSAYKGVGWTTRTETWTSTDLPIPEGATVEKALLFFSYNWDQTTVDTLI